jgi:O-antigen biosynthesis protein
MKPPDRARRLAALSRALPRLAWTVVRRRPAHPPRVRFVYTDIGAPTRYRVHAQVEQARIAGLEAEAVPVDDPGRLFDLAGCDLLVFHRLPLGAATLPLALAARRARIPLLFDSDDLVWDPRERTYSYLDDHYDAATVRFLVGQTRRAYALMRLADAFVFSTPYLAERARRDFSQAAYDHPNALWRELVALSEAAYQDAPPPASRDAMVLGYFSGHAHVHDEDVASIGDALCATLDRFSHVRLHIYGHLELRGALAGDAYVARIERRPAVDWRQLPAEIARVDVNLAPLVDNPQRRGKSAIKFYEAGAVGVPTVAVRLDPYQRDIAHGETGFLAATTDEWRDALARLAASPTLRRGLGEAARRHVLASNTTDALAERYAALLTALALRPVV